VWTAWGQPGDKTTRVSLTHGRLGEGTRPRLGESQRQGSGCRSTGVYMCVGRIWTTTGVGQVALGNWSRAACPTGRPCRIWSG
jgi:hypothetical protein